MQKLLDIFSASPKHVSVAAIMIAVVSLAFALISEYVFGLKPCILCVYQRIPYAVVIALGVLMLCVKNHPKAFNGLLMLVVLALVVDAFIAGYHVGVEQHWWVAATDCGDTIDAANIEELLQQLKAAPAVKCDEPAFTFLGLSMAAYNMVWALLSAFFMAQLYRVRKND